MITFINPCPALDHLIPGSPLFKASAPPNGILALAAYIKQFGYSVDSVIDLELAKLSRSEFVEKIMQCPSRIIGISTTTQTANNVLRLSKLVKELRPDIVIVVGGPHISCRATEFLSKDHSNSVDLCVIGEGEITLKEILEYYTKGRETSLAEIKGIAYRNNNGNIAITSPRPLICDLDILPFPDRSLIVSNDYTDIAVQTSRGCPGSCPFCAAGVLFNGKYRCRSPENVAAELEYLKNEYEFKSFAFTDDTFTACRNRILAIAELIERRKLFADFYCEARIDTLDSELISRLSAIGCTRIQIGIESANEATRKKLNKYSSNDRILEVSGLLRDSGITPITNFVLGLPHETIEDMNVTLNLAQRLVEDYKYIVNFSVCTPLPGTAYRERPEDYGIEIFEYDYDFYGLTHPVFRTKWFDEIDLGELYVKGNRISHASVDGYLKRIGAIA